ncbi:MAG: Gfo/Idh/MocA family oxidoreductase [Actinobacteria bacterium]|nr:Gfo/Idh/MocA family oxidoreductase [Actinomycetota bacterium]
MKYKPLITGNREMKQLLIKNKKVIVEELPDPSISEKELLVRNEYSAVSTGTELAILQSQSKSLIAKALQNPQLIKNALKMGVEKGAKRTASEIKKVLDEPQQLGYSCAGTVVKCGSKIRNFKPGDRVACAGASFANHAEMVAVPENLAVRVPDGISLEDASFTAIGAIALQGVRRLNPQIGENIAVLGLGLLGLISVQILKACGCHVLGIDIKDSRLKIAKKLGADLTLNPAKQDIDSRTLTWDRGADAVIVTASSGNGDVLNFASKICRKKGKIVLVGGIDISAERDEIYKKELDILMSTSLGPGRYDLAYEEKGVDYPYSYIRWTENRNMKSFLNLLSQNKIMLSPLIGLKVKIDDAATIYQKIKEQDAITAVIHYPEDVRELRKIETRTTQKKKIDSNTIKLAFVGAGAFATSYHLPNLVKIPDFDLTYLIDTNEARAKELARRFNVHWVASDYLTAIEDPGIKAAIISTRHDLHAKIAIDLLKRDIGVLIEKPAAVNLNELKRLKNAAAKSNGVFTVGFNRRFSPLTLKLLDLLNPPQTPMVISYRINAGMLPIDSWPRDEEIGGGRVVGEICHFIDYCSFIAKSRISDISFKRVFSDNEKLEPESNITIAISFQNGSIANITYTTLGGAAQNKENIEIFCESSSYVLDDFRSLTIFGKKKHITALKAQDKGHFNELVEFLKLLRGEDNLCPTLEEIIETTEATIKIRDNII